MRVPIRWLTDYIDMVLSAKDLANALTMTGTKVEALIDVGANLRSIYAGRVESLTSHPSESHLLIAGLEMGPLGCTAVVTAATNVAVGDIVPVALCGGRLNDGTEIAEMSFSGVVSRGMLCSSQELGISQDASGILHLPEDMALGTDVVDALGLRDEVLELEITPNRPDCLGIYGVAREVAAITRTPLKSLPVSIDESGEHAGRLIKVVISDPDLCPRYGARVFTDMSIGPSPLWMQVRLTAAGVRPHNNMVDITNYVMLELAQPLHAFDYDSVTDHTIVVRRAVGGEHLVTLDGIARELSPEALLITDPRRILGIAGIMGGMDSEIEEHTRTVVLEAANFARQSIWKTSKALKLRTEASARFEKGLDPEAVTVALDRAAHLVQVIGAGKVAVGVVDAYPGRTHPTFITTTAAKVNAVLGTSLDIEITRTLESLGFGVENDEDHIRVSVPSYRRDVREEIDLVEEVARMYGYNEIPYSVPSVTTPGGFSNLMEAERACRSILTAQGITEAVTLSLISRSDTERLGFATSQGLCVANPMSDEHVVLRPTLLSSALRVVETNIKRGNPSVAVFELGKVYAPSVGLSEGRQIGRGEMAALETKTLCIALSGLSQTRKWYSPERHWDFFDIKGIVEAFLCDMGVQNAEFKRSCHPSLHPGRSADIMLSGRLIGSMGQIHPDIAKRYDVPAATFVAELDFEAIAAEAGHKSARVVIPKFPASQRDIALLVDRETPASAIAGVIRRVGQGLVEDVSLFDVYEGLQVPQGMRSLAFSVTYRALDHTLTSDEVNDVHEKVRRALARDLPAVLR